MVIGETHLCGVVNYASILILHIVSTLMMDKVFHMKISVEVESVESFHIF